MLLCLGKYAENLGKYAERNKFQWQLGISWRTAASRSSENVTGAIKASISCTWKLENKEIYTAFDSAEESIDIGSPEK